MRPEPIPLTDPVVEAYRPGIDRTLLERNLRLTVDERLRQLQAAQQAVRELRAGMRRATRR